MGLAGPGPAPGKRPGPTRPWQSPCAPDAYPARSGGARPPSPPARQGPPHPTAPGAYPANAAVAQAPFRAPPEDDVRRGGLARLGQAGGGPSRNTRPAVAPPATPGRPSAVSGPRSRARLVRCPALSVDGASCTPARRGTPGVRLTPLHGGGAGPTAWGAVWESSRPRGALTAWQPPAAVPAKAR